MSGNDVSPLPAHIISSILSCVSLLGESPGRAQVAHVGEGARVLNPEAREQRAQGIVTAHPLFPLEAGYGRIGGR